MKKYILALSLLLSCWAALPLSAGVMTYQGRLKEAGLPVSAVRYFSFDFCGQLTGGTCFTTPSGPQPFTVQNGLFISTFTVPSADLSAGVWYLQVSVGPTVVVQPLAPRELLTSVPYAVYSASAAYAAVSGSVPSAVAKAGDTMIGALTISGSSVTINANTVSQSYALVTNGVAISTGGALQTIGAGNGVVQGDPRGTGAVDLQTFRASNLQVASGNYSVISGGRRNTADTDDNTVAGGYGNYATGSYAVISGGLANQTGGAYGVVSGGSNNSATGLFYSIVSGGYLNIANGDSSNVSGGRNNSAGGNYAVVPGGKNNAATGQYSLAAGYASTSAANGTFTWADSLGVSVVNSVADRTLFKNLGGFLVTGSTNTNMTGSLDRGVLFTGNGLVGISTGTPQAALDVVSTGTAAAQLAQIWRDSNGVIKSSMSATGVLMAAKFIGDGSALTGTSASAITNAADALVTAVGGAVRLKAGGSDRLVVLNGGNVGIGEAAPGALLTVKSTAAASMVVEALRLVNPASGNLAGVGLTFMNNSNQEQAGIAGFYDIPTNTKNTLAFYTGNSHTEQMRISDLGWVAVGTTTPTSRFDVVNGSITTRGASAGVVIGDTARVILPEPSATNGAGLRISTNTYMVGFSSAAKYYGDGSALTGIVPAGALQKAGDTMSGDLNMGGKQLINALNLGVGFSGVPGKMVELQSAGAVPDIRLSKGGISNWDIGGNAGIYLNFVYNTTPLVTFAWSGGVGIGTAAPTRKLDVAGDITATAYEINGSTVLSQNGTGAIGLGQDAGKNNTASYNVFIGSAAGISNTTGTHNVFVGPQTGYFTNSNDNTILGYQAGYSNIGGNNNTFLGSSAGYLSAGSSNIIIGYNQNTANAASSNQLNIGGVLFGNLSAGTIGISTRAPQAALDIVSSTGLPAQVWRDTGGIVTSSMSAGGFLTAAKFIGDGSGLLNVAFGGGSLTASSATVTGDAFSVGGSTFVVKAGKVGIGTATPGALLDVEGGALWAGDIMTTYISGNATPLSFKTGGTVRMFIDNNTGNIGVGTSSPGAKFNVVNGSVTITGTSAGIVLGDSARVISPEPTSDNGGGLRISTNIYVVGFSSASKYFGDGSGLLNVPFGGNMAGPLTVASSITVTGSAFSVGGSTFIVKAGNVGVGTLNPAYALDISTVNAADSYTFRAGVNGIVISTGGAIQTTGAGYGTVLGNARGNGAVDLQTRRYVSTQVASADYSAIGGGTDNAATDLFAVVSGGAGNRATKNAATVGGGNGNLSSDTFATVAGGISNTASGVSSAIGGGNGNSAAGNYAAVAGGQNNQAAAMDSAIGGGYNNQANGQYSTVAGGSNNKASANYAAVPGGIDNMASGYASFAAGQDAKSSGANSFTWTDSNSVTLDNSVPDRTVFKNKGGFLVTGSTNTNISGTADRGVFITGNGMMGISIGAPQAALDIVSTGSSVNDYAQIWRKSDGTVVASMTATGVLYASVTVNGDGLGNHTATMDLNMMGNSVNGAGTVAASGAITAAYYQISGSTVLAVGAVSTSIGLGVGAGQTNTGANDTFLGYHAGYNSTNGTNNLFAGFKAGLANTYGSGNSFLGMNAGFSNTFGNYNTFLGGDAGHFNVTGSSNTIIGMTAGYSTTGTGNIFLGYGAGHDVTAGIGNVVIGLNQDTSFPGANNELNIGGVLFGDLAAGTIGISTRAPQATLDVNGTVKFARQLTENHLTSAGGITLTRADFGKTITISGATATSLNVQLPTVGVADIGAQFTIVKLTSDQVIVNAPVGGRIADSGAGGTIYNNSAAEDYASITLRLVSATQWVIVGGDGDWTTTN